MAGERVEHLAVDLRLLVDAGFGRAVEEAQLGAEQADALGRRLARRPRGRTVLHVGQDGDDVPVGGGARAAPALGEFGLAARHGRRHRVAAASSGDTVTVPSVPSTITMVPAATASRPSTATTQGMPSWRAMIAVWLVGPPSVVAERDDQRGVQTRRVDGRQVLGAQDRRHLGHRHAGFGQAVEFGDDAVADVPQVGHPLGHQPAELGEHRDELVDGAGHRAHRGVALADALLGGGDPGPVLRQRAPSSPGPPRRRPRRSPPVRAADRRPRRPPR